MTCDVVLGLDRPQRVLGSLKHQSIRLVVVLADIKKNIDHFQTLTMIKNTDQGKLGVLVHTYSRPLCLGKAPPVMQVFQVTYIWTVLKSTRS